MVVYTGIFVKKSITAKAILSRKISHPHLTLAYMPDKSVIEKLKPYLGYSFRMTVSGYGCDGENEGYLISEISHKSKEIPEVMEFIQHCRNASYNAICRQIRQACEHEKS